MSETETVEQPTKVSDLGKAVAVIERSGTSLAIPQNLNQQIEFAKVMSVAGQMIGKPFRGNPGACLAICNQAWQWGMNPFAVSQKAYLVNDIIAFEAQLVHAVVLKLAPLEKRPRFSYDGEGPNRRCTVTFYVKGETEPLTYTSPPFDKITPKNSPLWKADPDQQHAYYTIRAGARRYFPEVLMGVLDQEEAAYIAEGEERKQRTYTLSDETVVEAEFSDGTAILAKNAEKQKAKNQEAAKKKAASKGGQDGEGSSKEEPSGTDRGLNPSRAASTPGGGVDAMPIDPEPEPNEPEFSDEGIIAQVEAEVRAAKTGKREIIISHRGALERIRQTSEDPGLVKRADSILNRYELD